jgi:Domain of unknown function (DUF4352)
VKRKKLTGGVASSVLIKVSMVFLALVIAFIGGCGGEESPSSSVDAVDEQVEVAQEPEPAKSEPAEESAAYIGDTVTIGDVQWTVTNAEPHNILVSRLGTEEGDFVVVDLTFANNSNQDITLATPLLTLLDSEGREFEADIESNFFHVYEEENMFVDHVVPGATKEGKIIYSVDPGASGFKLQVGEGRFASNETRLIDLGI